LHYATQVNAAAHLNLAGPLVLGVVPPQLRLEVLSALDGIRHRGKLDQERLPNSFNDMTPY
jgi:hypothetical protein